MVSTLLDNGIIKDGDECNRCALKPHAQKKNTHRLLYSHLHLVGWIDFGHLPGV